MREFKTAKGWAILIYATAPLLIGLFTWLLVEPFVHENADGALTNAYWFLAPLSIGMIGLMGYGLIETKKWKFVIDSDKIYAAGTFSRRQLRFDEIKGYRIDDNYISIEPNVAGKKKINISTYLGKTDEIVEWLSSYYPDLDLLHAEQEEQEILENEELGWTIEQREEKLLRARKTAKVLNWVGGLFGAWAFFWPAPYELAIVASITVPIVAVAALKLSSGLIRIDERKDSAYPSILWAVLAPSMGLCLRALLDYNIFSHNNVWIPSSVIAFAMITVLMIGNKEFKFKKAVDYFSVLVIASILFAYSYGSIITVNCMNDNSEPVVFNAKVLSKRISSGKSTTYYLELTPWGLQKEIEEVSVSQDLYEQLERDDLVSIYFMKGYLGIPWFIVTD
ncbi:hypothetical protein [Pontibacter beigongshangensis]|uniref:hypothetical protein n=1 Tax=Pontibacter beigongshangensis TaxID=2574733 RepID=UPI0016502498|nr:hypothetical protein [Pontibacter beigongshangensis]